MEIRSQQHVDESDTLKTMTYNLRVLGVAALIFVGVFLWRKLPDNSKTELTETYIQADRMSDMLNLGPLAPLVIGFILEYKAKTKVRTSGKYVSHKKDGLPHPDEAGVLLTVPRSNASVWQEITSRTENNGGPEHLLELLNQHEVDKRSKPLTIELTDAGRAEYPRPYASPEASELFLKKREVDFSMLKNKVVDPADLYDTQKLRDGLTSAPMQDPTPVVNPADFPKIEVDFDEPEQQPQPVALTEHGPDYYNDLFKEARR